MASSSSSSSSSNNKQQVVESKEDRKKRKMEAKLEKEQRKKNETPEERQRRRLEKRAKKDEKRGKKTDGSAAADSQVLMGYSNQVNPFNDANLTEKFTWKAKKEKMIRDGMHPEEYRQRFERNRSSEISEELEKAKKRREEKEKEQELWEQERERLQRLKDGENNEELERKEEEFHLQQAQLRSEKRLEEGRPKPIDLLYRALKMDTKSHYEQSDPSQMFKRMDIGELESLGDNIGEFEYLDVKNAEYWTSARTLCEHEIKKRKGGDSNGTGVHSSLTSDILKLLQGKKHSELVALETQITQKLQTGGAMNVEYWESLLKHLQVYKAMTFVRETFLTNLEAKISDMETEEYVQRIKNEMLKSDQDAALAAAAGTSTTSTTTTSTEATAEEEEIVQYKDDYRSKDPTKSGDNEEDLLKRESEKFMDEEREEKFDIEVELAAKHYAWHDKHRPRKPKFFNRVHTGYDWSKYNRTHYDSDNPPPKIVQGYKFNIFYPDLIDKTKSPKFFLQESDDGSDTMVLRFSAGPPYEDIAFRIVNREWEHSHRKGYKCVFEKGVLHLWFNFKRYRYRR
ncbi:hypothetical protein SAMD00019534_037940 [Acytostelium subglobosum LB1]|uniref:hypothetical protein n=1 Tax=Acytostelium subglobosum LB1 TaxID=1410327 RepID=UPI000644C947|nr:hypothetical protein SAMD00019534_037940 [Acytostelium subglobosum LB1]GAM20619.1 hypothetical protein SAMD00019534_037940 [Acytostelium subglobosum LB1]|eukprot:XP_012760140.1 hypothetical protein SAMD00019534_037940 [Acytostelium subglobosum LB1]